MALEEVILAIHKTITALKIQVCNSNKSTFTQEEFGRYTQYVAELSTLEKKKAAVQTQNGTFYYKPEALQPIHKESFFHKNLLSDDDVEKLMREDAELAKKHKLATCVPLCSIAYFQALELSEEKNLGLKLEIVDAQYWTHSILRLQKGNEIKFYDPWVGLQPEVFKGFDTVISNDAYALHLFNVFLTCSAKNIRIGASSNYDIAQRKPESIPWGTMWRKSGISTLNVAYGNQRQNKIPIYKHFSLTSPGSFFGTSTQEGARMGCRMALLETALGFAINYFTESETVGMRNFLLPVMITTVMLGAAIGMFNATQYEEDAEAKSFLMRK